MNEKILSTKKNGMGMLLLFSFLYMIAIAGCIFSAISKGFSVTAPAITVLIISIIWLTIGWVPFLGLKVLKPQEAFVLTFSAIMWGHLKRLDSIL